jgi:endo-1,4-beta-xylanase
VNRSLRLVSAALLAGLIALPTAAYAAEAPSRGSAATAATPSQVFVTGQVTWQGKGVDGITVEAYGKGKSPVASAITYAGTTAAHGGFALLVDPGATYKIVVHGGSVYADVTTNARAGDKGGSAGTVALSKPISLTTAPTISPTKAKVGTVLSATTGVWSFDVADLKISYQWLSNGKPIKKATDATYKTKRGDKGHKISVAVTAGGNGYVAKTATSNAVTVKAGGKKPVKKH